MRMTKKSTRNLRGFWCLASMLLLTTGASSQQPKPTAVRKIPASKAFSGFLSDYSKLKPNPTFERTLSYLREDRVKNIHAYVAILVEPVAVYVATDADEKAIPERGQAALADYFQQVITNAVGKALPVVRFSGPLVLRLRSALVGVDVGAGAPPPEQRVCAGEEMLATTVNIGEVGVEVELVDSETGEQIAAAVDRQTLGKGAVEAKFRAATEDFDSWAERLLGFLDSPRELPANDATQLRAYKDPGPPRRARAETIPTVQRSRSLRFHRPDGSDTSGGVISCVSKTGRVLAVETAPLSRHMTAHSTTPLN